MTIYTYIHTYIHTLYAVRKYTVYYNSTINFTLFIMPHTLIHYTTPLKRYTTTNSYFRSCTEMLAQQYLRTLHSLACVLGYHLFLPCFNLHTCWIRVLCMGLSVHYAFLRLLYIVHGMFYCTRTKSSTANAKKLAIDGRKRTKTNPLSPRPNIGSGKHAPTGDGYETV